MNFLREFDGRGHELAAIQARMFSKSSKENYASYNFIKLFSFSTSVSTLDDLSFIYKNISEEDIYSRTIERMHKYGGEILNEEVMHWIGYFYRAFCYMTGMKSSEAFKKIQPKYLSRVYRPYHTQDIVKAIKMVIKDLGIKIQTDEEKIMDILRKYA